MLIRSIKKTAYRIFYIGVDDSMDVIDRSRVIYFNTILLALPIVYAVFVLYDIKGYIKPLDQWYLDQFSFFVFSGICILCFYLNHFRLSPFSKILFLILWPLILHIIPIIVQTTPTDYYFAFPMGLIFHSLMIQAIFSSRRHKWLFWIFLMSNFFLSINFLDILQSNDTEGGSELRQLAGHDFYVLVVMLYWLLFNFVVFYLMRVIDKNLEQLSDSNQLVKNQKQDLETALRDLKDSNDKLIQSEKMASLGVFTAGIAHELNNPLNFISSGVAVLSDIMSSVVKKLPGGSQTLEEEMGNLEKAKYGIDVGVKKSTEIVKNLSNYARPGSEEFGDNDLVECIESSLSLFPASYLHKVEIEKELPDRLELKCNPGKLSQVFVNLIQNAIDASENGKVTIKAADKGKKLEIEISDTGAGMNKKTLDRIYDPFFTTKEVGKGTGLGLYIVFAIIKEHRGSIEVKSKVNQGTTFKIKLPLE